ncbi:MAG: chemotaxis response regulator protein-glutamate methylesterase [Treponema sp.]|nr:MAG: chemotaxis response regulator protein-glutamate methylesterase [Treponema sp.]
MNDIAVLIVDDSALMRSLIGRIVDATPGLKIAEKAMNGRFALQKLNRANPDVIVLDLEMPEMSGLQFLEERRRLGIDIPVIVLSSIAKEGARVTFECLEKGASDFITKPTGSNSVNIKNVADNLTEKLLAYGGQYKLKKMQGEAKNLPEDLARKYRFENDELYKRHTEILKSAWTKKPSEPINPVRKPANIELIAIGVSTGGPNALRQIFADISPDLKQPILVVQHMPAGFTEEFANSLNKICPLEVKEAADGDIIKQGRILIAPGGRHLTIEKKSLATIARITDTPPESGHKPSADTLFNSVAKAYENKALGIIMTGMGKDGARGLSEMLKQGARTIGQDEDSCIVYGMPRVAFEMGAVMEQVSLDKMAQTINTYGTRFA